MSKQVNKTVVGGFVVSAIVLLVGSVFIFSGGAFFKKTVRFVTYFQDSVKGLSVGAPVLFRGVQIGQVADIVLHADKASLDVNIPVYIDVDPKRIVVDKSKADTDGRIDRLIERGLRAEMSLQSLVTGQMMIELDYYPDIPARLTGLEPDYQEIPSARSSLNELSDKLKKLPIEQIADKLLSAIKSFENVINDPKLPGIINNLNKASRHLDDVIANADKLIADANTQVNKIGDGVAGVTGDAQNMIRNLDGQIEPVSAKLQTGLEKARIAFAGAHNTLKSVDSLIDKRSEVRRSLDDALKEIAAAARSLRRLTDYLERHPEALLQGKGRK